MPWRWHRALVHAPRMSTMPGHVGCKRIHYVECLRAGCMAWQTHRCAPLLRGPVLKRRQGRRKGAPTLCSIPTAQPCLCLVHV